MSESNRISQLLSRMRQASIQASIKYAKAISKPCGPSCYPDPSGNMQNTTPLESDNLAYIVTHKLVNIQGTSVGLESSRIQKLISDTIQSGTDPLNPLTRFVEYQPRVVLPACPPVPLLDRNANLPKSSTKCPLPNKPYFPSQY